MCIANANELVYLHNEMEVKKTLVHDDDTNSVNIALVIDNNLGAKIVKYRDSIFHNEFYMDSEFIETRIPCIELDVYSFGYLMYETLLGYDLGSLSKEVGKSVTLEYMSTTLLYMDLIKDRFADVLLGGNGDSKKTTKITFKMSFEDIKLATDDFNLTDVLGGGGFGRVYKGKLIGRDGIEGYYPIVAKRLDTRYGQGNKEFYTELKILCEYKHENIIGLLGYCNEKDEKIIVYEHTSKGSLEKYLNDASLTWRNRLRICIDFATGLDFLHQKDHVVIHRDIKSAYVLLFDNWKTKVDDFGLSMISATDSYTINSVCGTPGYVDPAYLNSRLLTKESDIYLFGVVLFEMLCGKAIYDIHINEGESVLSFFIRGL
uniref:probable receptor-like protein kinase At2g39360 n=1 Tax=Erigeron canadensis TaxID=72917 RepID=UPI001CB945B8|nr:probable receptor-like protein kinase At2g39360 [Erigeron canadensis]